MASEFAFFWSWRLCGARVPCMYGITVVEGTMWEPVRHAAISRVGQMGTRTACRHLSCWSKFAWNLSIPALCSSVQARSASGSPLVCDHQDFIPSEMASRHLLCLTGSAWKSSSPALCASFQMLNATGSPFVCDHRPLLHSFGDGMSPSLVLVKICVELIHPRLV